MPSSNSETLKPLKLITTIVALLSPLPFVGCDPGGASNTDEPESTGTVQIAVQTVPSDIRCITIDAAGSRLQSERFSVTPGAGTTLIMRGISPGSTKFTGASYPVTCDAITTASVPSWIADAVTVTIVAGTQTNITLVMRPAGLAGIGVDFLGGSGSQGIKLGVWDSTNWDNAVFQ